MNHGIVCFRDDAIAGQVYDAAFGRGESVAIYTSKSVELRAGPDDPRVNNWRRAFVRSLGEPAVLDPEGYGRRPGFRHPTGEIVRYEPESREQFLYLLPCCKETTAVLPATVIDGEALGLLAELHSAYGPLCNKLHDLSHNDVKLRRKGRPKLRDVLGFVHARNTRALFLIDYRYTPLMVFVSDSVSDTDSVADAVVADGQHGRLIEKW